MSKRLATTMSLLLLCAWSWAALSCGGSPCTDCPSLILVYPKIAQKTSTQGAITLDFTLEDQDNWFLIYKTDADFVRNGATTQIKPKAGGEGTITTPTSSLSTTPDRKAFRLDYFRIFVPLRVGHVELLGNQELQLRIGSLGKVFHVYRRATHTISFVDAAQMSFRLESALWLGKLPDGLNCVDKIKTTSVHFSPSPDQLTRLSWRGGCL